MPPTAGQAGGAFFYRHAMTLYDDRVKLRPSALKTKFLK
ncbi:hypothetical protein B194_5089 [Serratia plymuthica A30]|nr:hypothetical protein B194_5089 [Serratia plymuthica A30]